MTSQGRSAARPSVPIIGAFAPAQVLQDMPSQARIGLLGNLSDAGFTYLLTEGTSIPHGLKAEVEAAGLLLGGGLACFSDHAEALQPSLDHLRPIGPDGTRRPQMEWYQGLIPTDREYEDVLVTTSRQIARTRDVDVFILDFIRWPLHWELELRSGASVIDSSFDPITLRRFRDEMNVDVPLDDPASAADRVSTELSHEWTVFKCMVITRIVGRIAEGIRKESPQLKVGAFVVPGNEMERQRFAGQDVAAMASHLDLLLPMTYHAILHCGASWVHEVVADIGMRASVPIVPVLQATAEPDIAGPNDWGDPFNPDEFGQAIDAGLDAGGAGFVAFPAHGLDGARLSQIPSRAARVRNRSS